MPRYVFPGFMIFLEEAARQIGQPGLANAARHNVTLSRLANLCAQAGEAGLEHAPGVMARAAEFRDQLHAAHMAADLMIDEVNQSLGLVPKSDEASAERHEGRARVSKPRKS